MPDRTCTECDREPIARGWCTRHYQQWRKTGDPIPTKISGLPCWIRGCGRKGSAGWSLCERHYRRYQRHGDPCSTSRIVGDDPARFASYVRLGTHPAHDLVLGECWIWTGLLTGDGYAVMGVVGRPTSSGHGWSYEYHVGPIPPGCELDHLCRIRRCVNPWHLDPVPHAVNIKRANDLRRARSA